MTIISPLQGKKEAIGVNLASVIEERIKEDVSLKEITIRLQIYNLDEPVKLYKRWGQ